MCNQFPKAAALPDYVRSFCKLLLSKFTETVIIVSDNYEGF